MLRRPPAAAGGSSAALWGVLRDKCTRVSLMKQGAVGGRERKQEGVHGTESCLYSQTTRTWSQRIWGQEQCGPVGLQRLSEGPRNLHLPRRVWCCRLPGPQRELVVGQVERTIPSHLGQPVFPLTTITGGTYGQFSTSQSSPASFSVSGWQGARGAPGRRRLRKDDVLPFK